MNKGEATRQARSRPICRCSQHHVGIQDAPDAVREQALGRHRKQHRRRPYLTADDIRAHAEARATAEAKRIEARRHTCPDAPELRERRSPATLLLTCRPNAAVRLYANPRGRQVSEYSASRALNSLESAAPFHIGYEPADSALHGTAYARLKKLIREVPDFPKPGILFYDITTLLKDKMGFRAVIDGLQHHYQRAKVDVVLGIEARGFIFAPALAYALRRRLRAGAQAEEAARRMRHASPTIWSTAPTRLEMHKDAVGDGMPRADRGRPAGHRRHGRGGGAHGAGGGRHGGRDRRSWSS